MTITVAPSKVEALKQGSRSLRGGLSDGLADGLSSFDEDGYNLLKFHGVYQGYDRDSATELKQSGRAKEFRFMVRARLPGGRVTAAQYLALDAIADRFANGTLRITTRQGIQFHGVVKRHLKETIAAMNEALVTTLAACGDVVRNVTTVPAPIRDAVHSRLETDAKSLSQHLLPATRAYHEIWLDDEQVAGPEEDALYGTAYLPRKFKIGVAVPWDNSVDVLTNDLAIVALYNGDVLTGYNFALGGGLGMTHNKPKTFPRLATPVAFIEPDDLLEAAAAVVRLHRDYGDRSNRKHARLKYVIAEKGEAWAKAQLEAYLGKTLEDPRPMADFAVVDHLGWHEQGDGLFYLGVPVASGRIVDRPGETLRSALREIIERYGTDPILPAEPGHPSQQHRARRSAGDRGGLAPARRRPRRRCLPGATLVARLPGPADLRSGADRGGAHSGAAHRGSGGAPGPPRPAQREAQHPHHRLPQWLRPSLCRRYRACRPHAGFLRALCRRRLRRHAAEFRPSRQAARGEGGRHARSALRGFRAGAAGG